MNGQRLMFAGKRPKEQHLARHRHADLFLDTRFYSAHTTASDPLRVGVPLITVMGATVASRVAASLLKAVGLPELIVDTLDQYECLAVNLATNGDRLEQIRKKLSADLAHSPLFDTPRFVRHLERAYQLMWDVHKSGQQPQRIDVDIEC